ncbi:sensor histidine kinase [Sandaracinobacter sp.]|uniref:sensor histidine kinase n=1 Tax=Sandaracinobacter sp. TaxID=2487581 RepID=UPI0035B4C7AE
MNQPFRPLPQEQSADDDGAGGRAGAEPTGRMAILSIVGFWLVYFVLATARAAVTDMPAQDEMLLRRAVVTLVAMGLTGLLYLLLKRFEVARTGRLLTIAFAASVPLAFAYATVNYIAFYGFPIAEHLAMEMEYKGDKASYTSEPLSMITSSALEWYFFIASWAVMWVALSYAAKVRRVEREAAELRQAAQAAELRALRYQVNPHFLFNTLNSLSSLVMRARGEEAEQMILNLSTFFRASLTREASENVPLSEEVRLQLLYLDIEKVRFPERLIVKVAVPRGLEDALVPALILQPLVENAIKYGVSRSQRPVTVTIAADQVGDKLELWVRDDGEASPTAAEAGCGVGLANVEARLKAAYGGAADCVSGRPSAGGWLVRLTLPLIRA